MNLVERVEEIIERHNITEYRDLIMFLKVLAKKGIVGKSLVNCARENATYFSTYMKSLKSCMISGSVMDEKLEKMADEELKALKEREEGSL